MLMYRNMQSKVIILVSQQTEVRQMELTAKPILADPILSDPITLLVDPILADPTLTNPALADRILADPAMVNPTLADPILEKLVLTKPIQKSTLTIVSVRRAKTVVRVRTQQAVTLASVLLDLVVSIVKLVSSAIDYYQ